MGIIRLVIAILIAQAAGLIGSLFTTPRIPTWYADLIKPDFTPPGWVFGPAWVALYTLMGIASLRIWQRRHTPGPARSALVLYGVQLFFNVLWSVLFFGMRNPGLALIEIVVLWGMILWMMALFYRIDRYAAYLLIPYAVWVAFAAVLNFSIWRLN
jgi:translocator protein